MIELQERLGLTYADIHRYIRLGPCGDADTDARIRQKQRANAHKRRMPVIIDPFESEGGGRHEA